MSIDIQAVACKIEDRYVAAIVQPRGFTSMGALPYAPVWVGTTLHAEAPVALVEAEERLAIWKSVASGGREDRWYVRTSSDPDKPK